MSSCPTCGREALPTDDVQLPCPQCGAEPQVAETRRTPTAVDYFGRFPATITLIGINVLVFIAMLLAHVSPKLPTIAQLIRWGADSGVHVILHNQWWRIVTSAFVHIGAVHLIMNMWALWVLGTLAEAVLGTYLYLGIYLVCAIAGSLMSLYWHPTVVGAGASGAIMGILGAVVAVLKFARLPLPKPVLRSSIRSLVQGAALTLLIGLVGPIDNAAHVGGLITGLFIGLLLSLTRRADYTLQRPLRQICLLAPFALMVPLAFAVQRHGEPWIHLQQAEDQLAARNYGNAEKEARAAVRHLPNNVEALETLSTVLFYQDNDAEAGKYLRQLLAENPSDEVGVNMLAAIELREDDAIGARDLLMKALPRQPRNGYGQVYLGRALQALNQDNEAIAHYRQAIEIDPNLYEAQLALASIYEKEQQPQKAIVFYLQAAKLRSDELEPLRGLARAYLAAGMTQQANQAIAEIQKKQGTGNR